MVSLFLDILAPVLHHPPGYLGLFLGGVRVLLDSHVEQQDRNDTLERGGGWDRETALER